jgi:hypothetical protein
VARRDGARRYHVELADVALGDPRVPVAAELLVALDGTERLAKRERVHAHVRRRVLLVALRRAEELVEERRRDPRLEHEPAANVDAADLLLEGRAPRCVRAGHVVVIVREEEGQRIADARILSAAARRARNGWSAAVAGGCEARGDRVARTS